MPKKNRPCTISHRYVGTVLCHSSRKANRPIKPGRRTKMASVRTATRCRFIPVIQKLRLVDTEATVGDEDQMAKWEKVKDHAEAGKEFSNIAKAIAEGRLQLGRGFYAQSVLVGVLEAILCRRGKISIAEFGVWKGDGLRDLCKAAKYFRDE